MDSISSYDYPRTGCCKIGREREQIILYYTTLYYTILYYTILRFTMLYYTILYFTILYYTILYYNLFSFPSYFTTTCPGVIIKANRIHIEWWLPSLLIFIGWHGTDAWRNFFLHAIEQNRFVRTYVCMYV